MSRAAPSRRDRARWLAAQVVGAITARRASPVAAGDRATVALPGRGEVAYYTAGAGPPVVLLASLGRSVADFDTLAADLHAAGRSTLAVESRGIGVRRAPPPPADLFDLAADVALVLDAAGATRAAVIGHAFGNRVARTFAAAHPDRADRVVLVAAGGGAPVPPGITRSLFYSLWDMLPTHQRHLRAAFFAPGNPIPGSWRRGWHLRVGLHQIQAALATDHDRWGAAGGRPILVVHGSHDAVAPAHLSADVLRAEFPHRVQVVTVDGAGHALLPERPAELSQAVVGWLTG